MINFDMKLVINILRFISSFEYESITIDGKELIEFKKFCKEFLKQNNL